MTIENATRRGLLDAIERHRRLGAKLVVRDDETEKPIQITSEEAIRRIGCDPGASSHRLPEDNPDWRSRLPGWEPPMPGTSKYSP